MKLLLICMRRFMEFHGLGRQLNTNSCLLIKLLLLRRPALNDGFCKGFFKNWGSLSGTCVDRNHCTTKRPGLLVSSVRQGGVLLLLTGRNQCWSGLPHSATCSEDRSQVPHSGSLQPQQISESHERYPISFGSTEKRCLLRQSLCFLPCAVLRVPFSLPV